MWRDGPSGQAEFLEVVHGAPRCQVPHTGLKLTLGSGGKEENGGRGQNEKRTLSGCRHRRRKGLGVSDVAFLYHTQDSDLGKREPESP